MKADFVYAWENAGWAVIILSDAGDVLFSNLRAGALFGAAIEPGRADLAALWPDNSELTLGAFLANIETSTSDAIPIKLRTVDGQIRAFHAHGVAFIEAGETHYLIQLFTQETLPLPGEQEDSEKSVALKQKLDCALQLTRTVALDFNNALTSILGHTSLILSKMEANHPWRSSLVEVEKSAEKAAEVTSDLAAFSREEKDVRSQVAGNLNELVRRTVELFQNPGTKRLAWALQLEPRLYTANFDEAKLQQAFAKILENAVQASSETGQIIVRTRNQDVADTLQDGNVRLAQGCYVCLEFEDAGSGIAPDILPRIFEPFFTTKSLPHHRGLGLAWVYGIVTNHGGGVAVSSQPQRGTTVRIYLPAQKKIVRDHALQSDDLNGTETILLIDDEELLLTMGEMVLSSFGYRVLTANSGQKGLEVFVAFQSEIDLVITDLVMPKMSGRELIGQLRRIAPTVKVICSSGYLRALNAQSDELYLQKPFTSLDLLRKVKQALATVHAS